MLKSFSNMQRHETKQSIKFVVWTDTIVGFADAVEKSLCALHSTSDVIGKMAQLTTHHIVLCGVCGEMEMVSMQPTLKHKYQLKKDLLMEELLHNRIDITETRYV